MLDVEGFIPHARYTAASEEIVKNTVSAVVVSAAPRAPQCGIATTYAAIATGPTGPVNSNTQRGRSAAIRIERFTDTSSPAKPAEIRSARNGGAGANACPSTREAMAGEAAATRAAKGRRASVNHTASRATSRARFSSPLRMV